MDLSLIPGLLVENSRHPIVRQAAHWRRNALHSTGLRPAFLAGKSVLLLATVAGCSGGTTIADFAQEAVRHARQSSVDPTAKDTDEIGAKLPDAAPDAAAIREFRPPYPDRTDPFQRDDEENRHTILTPEKVRQVDVLGFANVGQSRVMLRIGDETFWPTEGMKIQGIEVVSIRPPSVELRQGSLTWTISLFDDNVDDSRGR